jgi:hypothetical protein
MRAQHIFTIRLDAKSSSANDTVQQGAKALTSKYERKCASHKQLKITTADERENESSAWKLIDEAASATKELAGQVFRNKVGVYLICDARQIFTIVSPTKAADVICNYLDAQTDLKAKDLSKVVVVTCNGEEGIFKLPMKAANQVGGALSKVNRTNSRTVIEQFRGDLADARAEAQKKLNEQSTDVATQIKLYAFAEALAKRQAYPMIAAWGKGLFVASDGHKHLNPDKPQGQITDAHREAYKLMLRWDPTGSTVKLVSLDDWTESENRG